MKQIFLSKLLFPVTLLYEKNRLGDVLLVMIRLAYDYSKSTGIWKTAITWTMSGRKYTNTS